MRKISFVLIALMIVMAFTLPVKVNASNPGHVSISDSRQGTALEDNDLCTPLTSINVSLQNSATTNSVCESCPTWYVSVWETNGLTFTQIGVDQAYTLSPSLYMWPNINWDSPDCIFLVWRHSQPSACGPCSTTSISSGLDCNVLTSGWNTFTDFYPPQ